MFIKAKIEAIIYAAEEPVTFAQIFELVKNDAREALLRQQLENEAAAAQALESEAAEQEVQSAGGRAESETAAQLEERVVEAGLDAAALSPESIGGVIPIEDDHESNLAAEPLPESTPESATEAPTDTVSDTTPEPVAQAAESTETEPESVNPVEATPAEVAEQPRTITDAEIKSALRAMIEELIADYNSPERGIEVRQIAGGYRMATKPEQHDAVRAFAKSLKPPVRLSLQALETLAVIAYKQPITSPEISEVRGVDSGGVLGTLLDRKLITTAGRKQVVGRPILYKTTKEFLLRFGLKDVNELPSMEEFEKLAAESMGADLFAMPSPDEAAAQTAATEAPIAAGMGSTEEEEPGEEAIAESAAPSTDVSPEAAEAQTAGMEAPLTAERTSVPAEQNAGAEAEAEAVQSTDRTEVQPSEDGHEEHESQLPAETES